MYSILILTLNEEKNLKRCLDSVANCHDVVVLDSYSMDATLEIAKSFSNVRVFQRKFDNYSAQRNYGLNAINYENPWLLMLDADEIINQSLDDEILKKLDSSSCKDVCLYRLRRKDYFMGKWLKYSSGYPTWFGRLMKIGSVEIKREINEEFHTCGVVDYLDEHIIHYPFNNGIYAWIEKHNRYSSMEAEVLTQNKRRLNIKGLFYRDPAVRRVTMKNIVYSMPFRPAIVFVGLFFIKRGFLDGKSGLIFCLLRSFYEFMINCKKIEIKLRDEGKPL